MTRTIRLLVLFSAFGLAVNANALPTLYDLTGYAGTEGYVDTGYEAAGLTDFDGINDDATAFLLFEFAGFADTTSFGIYDYDVTDAGIVRGDALEVFKGSDSPLFNSTVKFDLTNGLASIGDPADGNNAMISGERFGFYIKVGATNQTYYSHADLNLDGFDHSLMYDTSDNTVWQLMGSDVVLGWEDIAGGGDRDYNDMIVGITDVTPVPEPGTLALLGAGLALVGLRRRTRT